jgi:hypothetical protein
MKSTSFAPAALIAFFMFLSNYSIAQIDTAVFYRRIPRDHQARIITDPRSHMKYVLDTAHIYIEAVTQDGKRLWRTDPWKDSKWSLTLDERPIVIRFHFKNDSSSHFRDVLTIGYDNLGGAIIDAKTGKLITIARD